MKESFQENNIVSLRDKAQERLESKNLTRSEKLHLLQVLFNDEKTVLHGEDNSVQVPRGYYDLLLKGETEILYYALLLQRSDVYKWDREREAEPPPGWYIDIHYAKVKQAQALLDTHSLGSPPNDFSEIDILSTLWEKANEEQRKQIMRMFVEDSSIPHWYRASNEPIPQGRCMIMDDPLVMRYLPDNWRAHVEAKINEYKRNQERRA